MRVYITDLEAYNNGHLVGKWIQLPMDSDLLSESIEDILNDGRRACNHSHHHEEYFITDFECEYMDIEEYSPINKYNDIAKDMQDIDEDGVKAIQIMMKNGVVNHIYEAIENLDNIHCTGERMMEDVAITFIEETGALKNMPANLQYYFDYESFGRDMEINGSFFEDDKGVLWEYVA